MQTCGTQMAEQYLAVFWVGEACCPVLPSTRLQCGPDLDAAALLE